MHTQQDIDFLRLHRDADPVKLLFSSSKHPDIDMHWVADQIEGHVQSASKWPTLSAIDGIWYPPKLNREQSSSERLAQYKAGVVPELCRQLGIDNREIHLADLTGGFGIDTLHLAQAARKADYVELDEALCQTAQHNFETLEAGNISCHNRDSIGWIQEQSRVDIIYIDPARRNGNGRKVAAFEDCTPNLLENLDLLMAKSQLLIVKASPMISITKALEQLPATIGVDVVSLKGECKEVIFYLSSRERPLTIRAVEIDDATQQVETFTLEEEEEAASRVIFCSQVGRYLFEPNPAIMKAGCHNLTATRYNLSKLARNTHLYTGSEPNPDFPGRIFEVVAEAKPKEILKLIPGKKAHVAVRNYPLPAAELQKKLKLQEGGMQYVVGTTTGATPKLYLCNRIQ